MYPVILFLNIPMFLHRDKKIIITIIWQRKNVYDYIDLQSPTINMQYDRYTIFVKLKLNISLKMNVKYFR